jgi:hypothetical protein
MKTNRRTILAMPILLLLSIVGCSQQSSYTPQTPYTPQPYDPTPPTACISAQDAWNNIGQYKCVEYFVGNPFRSSKGNVFLNELSDYKRGFSAVIMAFSTSSFGDPISKYGNKTIRVTGLIQTYEGHPEIIVNNPANIILVK